MYFLSAAYYLLLALSLGCYGEQQGGGACSGCDGWRRRRSGQVMCRMRRSNRRPLPALLHGTVLAHAVPQVLLLPRSARRVQQHLLQQRRHDPLQERLHKVSSNRRFSGLRCCFVLPKKQEILKIKGHARSN